MLSLGDNAGPFANWKATRFTLTRRWPRGTISALIIQIKGRCVGCILGNWELAGIVARPLHLRHASVTSVEALVYARALLLSIEGDNAGEKSDAKLQKRDAFLLTLFFVVTWDAKIKILHITYLKKSESQIN